MSRNVYRLRNFTKKEIYYGTTEISVRERFKQHQTNDTKAIKHWNWIKNQIVYKTIRTNLSDKKAIEIAHKLETAKPPKGWTIIQTGGM